MRNNEKQALEIAYRQNGDQPIAYLDETYNISPQHDEIYYVMTAVVVEADQRNFLRDGLRSIAESSYWHTSEKARTEEGRKQVIEMLEYLAFPEGKERVIVSCQMSIAPEDSNGEKARRKTLTRLLEFLNSGGACCGKVNYCVLERRFARWMQNADASTLKIARQAGKVDGEARLAQFSPSVEVLLWLPDLVASAYRWNILGNSAYFKIIEDMTEILEVK